MSQPDSAYLRLHVYVYWSNSYFDHNLHYSINVQEYVYMMECRANMMECRAYDGEQGVHDGVQGVHDGTMTAWSCSQQNLRLYCGVGG